MMKKWVTWMTWMHDSKQMALVTQLPTGYQ